MNVKSHKNQKVTNLEKIPNNSSTGIQEKKSPIFIPRLKNHCFLVSIIQGAGLDVTTPEPLPKEHPLFKFPNVCKLSIYL